MFYDGMCIFAFIGLISIILFVIWLVYRGAKNRENIDIKPYKIMYGLSFVSGIFTFLYFFTTDISTEIKIIASIFVGLLLILLGSSVQAKTTQEDPKEE